MVSIYDANGNTNMGGRSYQIPGPRPITCSGSGGGSNDGGSNNGGGSSSGSAPLYGQ